MTKKVGFLIAPLLFLALMIDPLLSKVDGLNLAQAGSPDTWLSWIKELGAPAFVAAVLCWLITWIIKDASKERGDIIEQSRSEREKRIEDERRERERLADEMLEERRRVYEENRQERQIVLTKYSDSIADALAKFDATIREHIEDEGRIFGGIGEALRGLREQANDNHREALKALGGREG